MMCAALYKPHACCNCAIMCVRSHQTPGTGHPHRCSLPQRDRYFAARSQSFFAQALAWLSGENIELAPCFPLAFEIFGPKK